MTKYAELHCHSYYSLLNGTSSPNALVKRAYELGMSALALTDHDNLYGAVEFSQAAVRLGIKPIPGCELTLADDSHLTLLVKDQIGWQNLCWLITQAQHNAPKGEARLPRGALLDHTDGLIALCNCYQEHIAQALIGLFGKENLWIELQHHRLKGDEDRIAAQVKLAQRLSIGYVASNNVYYARQESSRLQDVLVCIRHNTTLDKAGELLRPNSEYYLKSGEMMKQLFHAYPQALSNTLRIAEQCQFKLESTLQALPPYPTPDTLDAETYLLELCLSSPRCHGELMKDRLKHEVGIIQRAGLANYFLVVWDIVRYAREQGIRCQGRGSAANSVVTFLLHISPIDPMAHDLVFERFLSDERHIAPDIDIDFDAARREEVIQYVYSRYGIEHAAMACTFITFRARSAVRDVGKALGLSPGMVSVMSKSLESRSTEGIVGISQVEQQLIELCGEIEKIPRHLGIHNGGMVITESPLSHRLPTEPASMPGRFVVQWDKEGLEDAGMVKIDILGLRMLSAISEAVELTGADLDRLSFDDPSVFAMISEADTIGVFQVESRAQAQMLPRFQPRSFADLIIAISLIRPGPLQGDMVHPYLRRRLGEEPVNYFHPLLEPALKETLGVILFQEQVLKVARDLAGFTPGQGELLRRALGRKDATDAIAAFENAFLEGALNKGVSLETARLVFTKLLGFGSYSFPKSHAAAFAVLVYQSAWLRRYYPAAFFVALLNNQPMGFYTPAVIVNDAQRHGIPVYPVHINESNAKCSLHGKGIRLGLNYVRGLGEQGSQRLLDTRTDRSFTDLEDLCQRTRLPQRLVENLIQAGAMDCWGHKRRDLIWQMARIQYDADALDLEYEDDEVELADLTEVEKLNMEYTATGLSTRMHTMALYRDWLQKQRIPDSRALVNMPAESSLTVAGQVIVLQAPPTAKGFRFITLEDEFGFMNVIVRPQVYERFRRVLREHTLLMVRGTLQREGAVINIIAQAVLPLPPVQNS